MGVPLFFRRLVEAYFRDAVKSAKPQRVTTLCLDLASTLHQARTEVSLRKEEWTMKDYFFQLESMILDLVNEFQPQQRAIFAGDGIPPLGKINRQRDRRFRAELEKVDSEPSKGAFDSNAISPGTEVMFEIDAYLRTFIHKRRALLPPEVIYSSHLTPGEGEHKITTYLRKLNEDRESVVIVGLDADLIFINLLIPRLKIHLYRDNIRVDHRRVERLLRDNPRMTEQQAQQESLVRESIFLDIRKLQTLIELRKIGLEEFILASFVFGNDFIPPLAGFNLIHDAADDFLLLLEGKKFADPFNLESFQSFLAELIPLQKRLIPKLEGKIPLKPFGSSSKDFFLTFPTQLPTDNWEDFRQAWNDRLNNRSVLPEESESRAPGQYFQTLYWILHYYQDHLSINWEWVYFPFWSPLIEDLVQVKEPKFDHICQRKRLQINLIGQLLLILPRDLRSGGPNPLLPVKVRSLQQELSPIFDFYPRVFSIIRDGVLQESDGFSMLPPIDYPRFLENYQEIVFTVKEKEKYRAVADLVVNRGTASTKDVELQQKISSSVVDLPQPVGSFVDLRSRKYSQVMGFDLSKRALPEQTRLFPDFEVTLRTNLEIILPEIRIRKSL